VTPGESALRMTRPPTLASTVSPATTTSPTRSRGDSSVARASALARARTVVWDVDGTLADSTELAFGSTNAVLRANGYDEIDRAEYLIGSKYTTPRRLAWHATKDPDDVRGEALGAAFDATYVGLVTRETTGFYTGIPALVERLRANNRRQAVLSNACGAYARAVVAANGVSELMERVYGADDVPAAKPAPDGLARIMREMGVMDDPSATAYVGDAPSDGAAAKAAGCVAVGVNWGSHNLSEAENARHFDVVFDTVEELERGLFAVLSRV